MNTTDNELNITTTNERRPSYLSRNSTSNLTGSSLGHNLTLSRISSSIRPSASLHRTESNVRLREIGCDGRRVYVNIPLPSTEFDHKKGRPKHTYPTNKIRTSKYTIISFVPKNLFEQFRRPANLYFLGMAIIQMLPLFGVKSPALTLLPICTVVVITAIKDAIEDFQRHKVDEQYNQNLTHTLQGYKNTNYSDIPMSNKWLPTNWFFKRKDTSRMNSDTEKNDNNDQQHGDGSSKFPNVIEMENVTTSDSNNNNKGKFHSSLSMDVRVGDFILLRNGDDVPADAVLLSTSDKNGICFVETKDLDGETNLKPRHSVEEFKHIESGANCLNECHFYVEAEKPDPDLYKFDGTLVVCEGEDHLHAASKTPVSIDNLLLRGHVIRNTKWAIAVILFTGVDTKIMLNSGETPSKRSQIDRQMNFEIFIAFIVLFILCLICAIMAGVTRHQELMESGSSLYTMQSGSPAYVGFLNFWSSLIIFQNIIPISLYVSIEFVKTFQAYFIWNDLDMWDEKSKNPCVPKTWTLSDDLGQVEYIFSDKTGTLTRNVMDFRECTIGGTRYGDNGFSPESEGARGARLRKEKEEQNATASTQDEENQASSSSSNRRDSKNNVIMDEDPFGEKKKMTEEEEEEDAEFKQKRKEIMKDYKSQLKKVFDPTYSCLNEERLSFADPQIFKDMKTADIDKLDDGDDHAGFVKEFFLLLSLCHTVVVEKIGKDGKAIEEEEEEDDDESDNGDDNSDDNEENQEEKNAPIVVDDDSIPPGVTKKRRSLPLATEKAAKIIKSGGSHLLKVPKMLYLNGKGKRKNQHTDTQSNDLSRVTSRGEEFDSVMSKEISDKVDESVKIQLEYKAESPDEAALVSAAKNVGFTFIKRKGNKLKVDILGKEYTFKLLDTLEFNSDRKRMSVILERPDPWNDIVIYCKGADNIIADRLENSEGDDLFQKTEEHIETFSNNGLRTLMLSYRILEKQEYDSWKREMDEASTSAEERSEKVAKVQEKIEVDLKLIGATAIEDKLQEGVPNCIEDLRRAGIKVWVLTGDKLETAINIGYASSLLDGEMKLWKVKGGKDADISKTLDDIIEKLDSIEEEADANEQRSRNHDNSNDSTLKENALVIEGSALTQVFETSELKEKLMNIANRCKSVVCCRVSPLQKALVVELVRKYHDVVTLAVGDGANDVSMIQVANVGVGIAGQEGVQAAMAADYAISQFRFLKKLILVQGHWSYARISEMILTFFFKNIFWVFPSLWYQIYSAWSGNIFYDYSFLQLYNIIFTVAPVVILGTTDQDITSPYLKKLPSVYKIGIERKLYTKTRFWIYFADGIWQSLVVFYSFFFLYQTNPNSNGYPESSIQFSTSVAITAIFLANVMPGFNTYYWTWWQFFFVPLEILLSFLWVVIYGSFTYSTLRGMAHMVFGSWSFWMNFFIAIVLAFLPRYLITFICQWWYPNIVAEGRHLELYQKKLEKKNKNDTSVEQS